MNQQIISQQSGFISLIGALSLAVGVSGFYLTMELGDKMVSQSNFDNYAQALAPVVLRSEMAITQEMVEQGDGYKSNAVVGDFLQKVGYDVGTEVDVTIKFGNMRQQPTSWTDPKTNIVYQIEEQFIPLNEDGYTDQVAANPKAHSAGLTSPVLFSAVSIEIKDKTGVLAFKPVGRAIYGLPTQQQDSGEIGGCFCKNRYNACLQAPIDTNGYPPDLADLIDNHRQNYCEYGYVPQKAGQTQTYYPAIELSSQWLGLQEKDSRTLITADDQVNFAAVNQQKPLWVEQGINPFPSYYWDFWTRQWRTVPSDKTLWAKTHDGDVLSFNNSANGYPAFKKTLVWPFPPMYKYDIKAHGYFYVGRQGSCIVGTDASNVPNISGAVLDPEQAADSAADAEVQRCLSYKTSVGTDWSTAFFFMPVSSSIDRYMQQSCVDYNRYQSTRVSFFQWMLMSWTWPFINWQTSYSDLDCVARNMRWYGSFVFGAWRQA